MRTDSKVDTDYNRETSFPLKNKIKQKYHSKNIGHIQENTIDNYRIYNNHQSNIANIIKQYIKNFHETKSNGYGLILKGNPFTGKSFLSLIIHRELSKLGYSAHYEPNIQFAKRLVENKFKMLEKSQCEIRKLINVDLLIIDKISDSTQSNGLLKKTEKQLIHEIIQNRYRRNLSTIIITNMDTCSLIKSIGAKTYDLLSEKNITLTFNWLSQFGNNQN